MNDPDWYLYRAFLAVAEEGSLSSAARVLGTTQPTMGRQIAALESALGVTLFARSLEGLALTESGQRLLPAARAMAAAAQLARRSVSGKGDGDIGTVRITASDVVGVEVLPPMLAQLRTAHPGMAVELVLSNRNEDLLRGDADIAVRMVRPTQETLVARKLGRAGIGLFSHKRYLKANGTPRTLDELGNHALIGYDRHHAYARLLGESSGSPFPREAFAFRTDNEVAQIAALRAGCGIGACQSGIAARDRNLVPVLPDSWSVSLDIWLVMHRDQRGIRRIRLAFDALAEALAAYARNTSQ